MYVFCEGFYSGASARRADAVFVRSANFFAIAVAKRPHLSRRSRAKRGGVGQPREKMLDFFDISGFFCDFSSTTSDRLQSRPLVRFHRSTTFSFITRPFLVGFARNQVHSTASQTAHLGRHVRHHTRDSEHVYFSILVCVYFSMCLF